MWRRGLPWWLRGKESTCQCRRWGFNPWIRKIPLEEEMETHSSISAWEIPWTEEPSRLLSVRSQRVGNDLVTKQQQQFEGEEDSIKAEEAAWAEVRELWMFYMFRRCQGVTAAKCRFYTDSSGRWGSEGELEPIMKTLNNRMEFELYFLHSREVFAGQNNTFTSLFLENNSRDDAKDGFKKWNMEKDMKPLLSCEGDFPGCPVVKTSNAGDLGSIPGQGTKVPHAAWCGQRNK